LKLGVLVNEVAHLDVDSQLLNTQQSNAAAGIKAAHLAGGCACCSVSADLQAALSEMASSINYQKLDYLVGIPCKKATSVLQQHHHMLPGFG
jgi:G3E family GTPase